MCIDFYGEYEKSSVSESEKHTTQSWFATGLTKQS